MPKIELSQGTIRYRDQGTGPTVVLIHGLLVNGTVWDEDLSSVAVSLSSNIEGVGGQSPSVSGDGSFSLIVSVSTHVTGSIGALATDCWGLTSDLVSVTVS